MIEREIVFDRNNYKSYKDFYSQIYKDLDGKDNPDFEEYDDFHYNADLLDEFLWYCHNDNVKYIFVGFDQTEIALEKTYDDYEFNIVIKIFKRFVNKYPNNELEFKDK